MYVCVYTYMYMCVYVCMCVYICICVCLYMCVHMCMAVYVCMCLCILYILYNICECLCICVYVYMCICPKLTTRNHPILKTYEPTFATFMIEIALLRKFHFPNYSHDVIAILIEIEFQRCGVICFLF